MIKKILFAVPLMTVLWLAPSAILAAEPAAAPEAAVVSEMGTTVPDGAAGLPGETAGLPDGTAGLPDGTAGLRDETAGLPGGAAGLSGEMAGQAENAPQPQEAAGPSEETAAQPETAAAEPGVAEEVLMPQPSYTEEDLYIMAHVLAGECQNCPDQEQLYVGSVVLNRRAHPSFPGTIKGVVFQKGQYSCTRDGNYYREPTERNWANARQLLEGGSVLPGNVVWQSGKKQGRGVYVKTKWHYYCY